MSSLTEKCQISKLTNLCPKETKKINYQKRGKNKMTLIQATD